MSNTDQRQPFEDRTVRVFVSSTFRDMQADRDVLVKKVFPQLRRLCESRGVAWAEVDLRWGIPSEQQAEGQVLPYCLAEIERSRPFFIGLLGERYGWVPDRIPADLLVQQEWLKSHARCSVTEMEILYGVLNNPVMAHRALFYFRAPSYVQRVPALQQADFIEPPQGPAVAKAGLCGLLSRLARRGEGRAASKAEKLADLKDRIRAAAKRGEIKYSPREDYPDPEALGELVLFDFTRIIDELYPPHHVPDPLDQEASRHEQYARTRRELYVARPHYYQLLDDHVAGNTPPVVLVGESGCGKTALLANWIDRWRKSHPNDLVIQHYIGSTPDSASWICLVTRILGEIKRTFHLPDPMPCQAEMLRIALGDWLGRTTANRRIVLVLDGLNQLEDRDNAQTLAWLPRQLPRHVRLLASALPSKALDATRERGWARCTVELLNPQERRELVTNYLRLGGRTPDRRLFAAIDQKSQTLNPLYLKVFLDEIRIFGRFEELPTLIRSYLSAENPKALYRMIVRRWMRDYPEARVAEVLRLIYASRRGLSEAEMMDLLGQRGNPFPRQRWTPFYLVAENALVLRSGLVNFAHDFLRVAVQEELLAGAPETEAAHLHLADYFESRAGMNLRKAEEWPWQLQHARAWGRLEVALTDPWLFLSLQDEETRWELTGYWESLRVRGRDAGESYRKAFGRWTGDFDSASAGYLAGQLGTYLMQNGYYADADPLVRESLRIRRSISPANDLDIAQCLVNLGALLKAQGKLLAAEPPLQEALHLRRKVLTPGHPDIANSLNSLGSLLGSMGRLAEGELLLREAVDIVRQTAPAGNPYSAACLNALALLLGEQGKREEAEPLYREALEIFRHTLPAGHPGIANGLNNLGSVLREQGKLAEAEALYREALEIHRQTLPPGHPTIAASLNNLGHLRKAQGSLDEAKRLYYGALDILRQTLPAGHPDIATGLNNLGSLLNVQGELAEAEPLIRKALEIYRQTLPAEHPDIAICVNNLAGLLYARGEFVHAEPLLREAADRFLTISLSIGREHPHLRGIVGNYLACLQKMGLDDAMIEKRAVEVLGRSTQIGSS